MDELQQRQQLAAYIGKLFRDSFGKGPEGVYVSFGGPIITVYVRNLMSATEQILMEQDQEETIMSIRAKLMQKLIPEIKANVEFVTGIELQEVYYDWALQNRSGMIVGIAREAFGPVLAEDYMGKEQLHDEIKSISQRAQKAPEKMNSYELNPRTIVVVRSGTLVLIEKELIRTGYEVPLKYTKRNVEKRFLHNNSHFEAILDRRVVDLFVDWDFARDKSVIVFVLNDMNNTMEMS
ncbi:Na-translocating system protein MpsC family protein [Alicyclobacillus ferrooxydans]|uniref:Na+-translocating membrane potential-generating system MpsC domain-containing protein n=1 Tax=Alicyclobacillus ferrooxydans TaxID=471514 RepID=A0A0P9CK65_9BACL|nr:Na-translocating system protein MpsC family protein [Alicyclobacillus ferrooxydans]KPV43410.1 hypothetical protein AN477_12465 [Alicyclobacillus ferrooxydans]